MKLRLRVIVIGSFLLASCNFTLAQDVTPPPGYTPPTPVATLGPLFPAHPPSTQNGAMIYAEKCAPCHGETGLGDGEQGIQLNVTVPAFGLPEIARSASPARWYSVVTQGNIERFMPPFASLSDQERWDVVAYVTTLHFSEEEIARGEQLFEENCAGCSTAFFQDQKTMSALSAVELARIIKQGNDQVPAFGADFSEDDLWATAAYLRTLSFDTAPIVSAPAASATPEATAVSGAETPAAELVPGAAEGRGTVSGFIDNQTGTDLPADFRVTLRGYDHGADPSMGPQEVFTAEGVVSEDGSFTFEDVEFPPSRIFIAEVTFDGLALQSDFAVVEEGTTSLQLSPITLYGKTEDASGLVLKETRIFLEYGTDSIQIFHVYTLLNPSDKIVVVKLDQSGQIPFIRAPEGSSGIGYEPTQISERFLPIENGFAIPPSANTYGMIAFASLPSARNFELAQKFVLPSNMVTIFVPEGITIENDRSTDLGIQAIQDFRFQIYELGAVNAGETLRLNISGTPREPSAAPEATSPNRNLLLGAGALGLALILAGVWMYLQEGNVEEEGEAVESNEFKGADDILDAIVALDDLHRARKIADDAYQKRRAELKEILKGMM
jgi:mono/diheme cytochrome c family protein